MHFFKPGQPTLNWLDPSFASHQLQAADVIKSLQEGARMLRLDANPFLGVERMDDGMNAHSEGTALAIHSSNLIAWLIRKLGGWSFQELNIGIEGIRDFAELGAVCHEISLPQIAVTDIYRISRTTSSRGQLFTTRCWLAIQRCSNSW